MEWAVGPLDSLVQTVAEQEAWVGVDAGGAYNSGLSI